MVQDLSIRPGETVLELGPGTGAITVHIRQIISDSRDYLGVEREASFSRIFEERFPDLKIVNDLAESAFEICESNALRRPKAIISGLPSSTLSGEVLDTLVALVDRMLAAGGIFRTFQYLHGFLLPSAVHFRQELDTVVGRHHRGRVVIKNLPPAIVLTWKRI